MANNQKAEEYLTEVMKQVSSGKYSEEGRSADDIAIPDENELRSLEDVESAFESMGDDEFLEMLIRVNEQMEEKNLIPPEFSAKTEKIKTEENDSILEQEMPEMQKIQEIKEAEPEGLNIEESLKEPEHLMPKEDVSFGTEELEESFEFESEEKPEELELEKLEQASFEREEGEEETLGTSLKEDDDFGLSNIIDFDSDMPEESLANMAEEDAGDLMASLDSIVQEVQGETSLDDGDGKRLSEEEFSGEYDKIAFEEEEKKSSKKAKKEAAEKGSKKSAKKKDSFGQKVKNLFFRVEVVQPLSEEEEEEQKQQKAQQKEEKKKAQAEAKKKKAAEKKEAAKQKKEEAAARKAAKPKKEKKPKPPKEPVSPEEIVHVRPMFLVFLVSVAAAIVISTITLSDTFGYRLAVQEAQGELENGRYEEAFQALNGLKLNDSDMRLYESLRILMRVEKQYRSYVNCSEIDLPNEALDSLVKAVGNYDKYVDAAESYGVKEELDALLSNVEYALGTYGLSLATVREWNMLEDQNEYTKRIMACTNRY